MSRSPGFKPCDRCKWPMPMSDLHSNCLRCLSEGHISDTCRICKSFKPRTKKECEMKFKAFLMELALTPSPDQRSDLAPSTAASVHSTPLAPSMSWYRSTSPTKKLKKVSRGQSPIPCKGKDRAGDKLRAVAGSSSPPS